MNYFLHLSLLKENTVSHSAEVLDACSIHVTCKHSVVRHHYISFKWHGPAEPGHVTMEPAARYLSHPPGQSRQAWLARCSQNKVGDGFCILKVNPCNRDSWDILIRYKCMEGLTDYLLGQMYKAHFQKLLFGQANSWFDYPSGFLNVY